LNTLTGSRVGDQPAQSPGPQIEECHKDDFKEVTRPLLAGLVGAAAMTVAVVAVSKTLPPPRRRKPLTLTSEQQALLKEVIARGEDKRWDLSYDEDFIFKILPALKAAIAAS